VAGETEGIGTLAFHELQGQDSHPDQVRAVDALEALGDDGEENMFEVKARVDSPVEVEYLRNGGILQTVLRQMLAE